MEAYVVSYRDTREKGGKVIYNLLLLGIGVTLPAFEVGLSMELGDTVVVKVRLAPWGSVYRRIHMGSSLVI